VCGATGYAFDLTLGVTEQTHRSPIVERESCSAISGCEIASEVGILRGALSELRNDFRRCVLYEVIVK